MRNLDKKNKAASSFCKGISCYFFFLGFENIQGWTPEPLCTFVPLLEPIHGKMLLFISIWSSRFNLGPVSHPPPCANGKHLAWSCQEPLCRHWEVSSEVSWSHPCSSPEQASAAPHSQLLRPLTSSVMQIWTPYSSQLLIYIKITANDPAKPGQQYSWKLDQIQL